MSTSEPVDGGWDDPSAVPADGVLVVAADEVRSVPPVVPARTATSADASPAHVPPPPPSTAPALAEAAAAARASVADELAGLSAEAQEQIFGAVRAALAETLDPLLEKQAELEARLEWLNQAEQRAAAAQAVLPRSRAPSVDVAGSAAPPALSRSGTVVNTSYGPVSMPPPGGVPRSPIEAQLANVGPIDLPDFGTSRRLAGRVVVALLLALVAAAIAATILSHT